MEEMLNEPRTPPDAPDSRTTERILEGVNFFAPLALSYWGATLAYSSVSDYVVPIYLLAGSAASGVLLGVWRYKRRPSASQSCVPPSRVANVSGSARTYEEKRAA